MRRAPSGPALRGVGGSDELLENLVLIVMAVIVGVGLMAWATGQVAGRLWGGEWPHVGASAMGDVLARLVQRPGSPADAWPAPANQLIPGAVAFYATLAAICVVVLGVVGGVWLFIRRLRDAERGGFNGGVPTPAEWARPRDLRPLVVSGPSAGRLILGYSGRKLLATERRQSVCVLGPTQTNKTTGFAIPAILEWKGPVLATSVKDDLVADTLAWRQSQGPVWIYDPSASTGREAATWSPLAAVTDWSSAQRMASWLSRASQARAGVEDAEFWSLAAEKLLAPHLLAASLSKATMEDVVRWIDTQEVEEVANILGAQAPRAALDAAWATWRREDRHKSSIFTTTEIVLRAFADPIVADSARSSDISPERLLDGRANTLYLCAPADEQERLRPVFATLVHQVMSAVYARAVGSGGLRAPLLVVLDEAANIAPLRDLDLIASTAAGVGIQLVTVWQDFSQLEARYGRRAHTVINNHRAKVVLSGISDPPTLDYVSRLSGDHEVAHGSVTRDASGRRSSTESTTYRQLAPADALRRVVPGHSVLVYGHLPPAQLRLRPWYDDRGLRTRSATVTNHTRAVARTVATPERTSLCRPSGTGQETQPRLHLGQ